MMEEQKPVMLCVPLDDVVDTLATIYTTCGCGADPDAYPLMTEMIEAALKRYRSYLGPFRRLFDIRRWRHPIPYI